ncbi:penicillin-binding protein 2 [Galbitalea sp. SE-J8]|uniref:peptidoglycan D,D-transpeptidase FtsI family protein n=1 Tax=Galbitalea sp. SE-J8 TaxID=3054952 RepID=UPI00259CD678|nr:penicillin-binding protein 2 [Galbitalea sp. SE-J8]MDM4763280.1 penicillin-binding protein 2 [Galbitalea sp. SE-J8]
MNRELKRVSILVLLMFVTLFGSTSVIQVVQADALRNDARNIRTLYASYSAQRGSILVDGEPIAESVRSRDQFKYQRKYPHGRLYAPVTGYYTLNQGSAGLESALNDYLSGTANAQFFDQVGSIFSGQDPKGASVETTIDPAVQKAAYDALGKNNGAVIAVEPSTGRILALVSKHSYDPNELAVHSTSSVLAKYQALIDNPDDPLIDRAIAGDLYYPGSTFKLVVGAAALESGQYTVDSEFDNPPELTLPGTTTTIGNAEGGDCGGTEKASIATAIRLSCNIPMAELGLELGQDAIGAEAAKFGFGQSFQIPMKATASTYPTGMDDPQTMLSAFGQYEDRVTPLQMALVSAAIANNGTLMNPTLVDQIIAPDLSIIDDPQPTEFSQPLTAANAAALRDVMVQGVTNGAASNATIEGVSVAGKTGTAQNGGDLPHTLWFTGFAPADNPQVAVAVVVENGGGMGQNGWGNLVAAPMAKKVIEAVLNR